MPRLPITELKVMKQRGEKIPMLTAYDYPTARLVEQAGVPIILVGDSLGMVVLGYDSTVPVTMEDIIHHTKAVVRGTERAIVVADMPFGSYQVTVEDAVRNAARILKETGATAVKLEGGQEVAETVRRLTAAGIPVMGHLGLTPQSVNQLGGYRLQGKTPAAAVKLLHDAKALEDAGAFAVVLETIPARVAECVTQRLEVPTIGIGAGPFCDGQVQVLHDFLGIFQDFVPRHAKQFAQVGATIREAVATYIADVQAGSFPTAKESFGMKQEAPEELRELTPYGGAR
jgi:3-methyl-2-oxobutanoate hydroxymethyltransferase